MIPLSDDIPLVNCLLGVQTAAAGPSDGAVVESPAVSLQQSLTNQALCHGHGLFQVPADLCFPTIHALCTCMQVSDSYMQTAAKC